MHALRIPGLILLLGLIAQIAASRATEPDSGVNPLTGTPVSLEQARWALEQARLDEQLQASLLNRRRFELERQRLEAGVPVSAGAEAGGTAGALPTRASAEAPAPLAAGAARVDAPTLPAATRPVRARASTVARARSAPPWSVLGVRSQGSGWCLLVAEAEGLLPLCAGAVRAGHHLDAVAAESYTIDGVVYHLEVVDTRIARPGGGSAALPVTFTVAEPPQSEALSPEASAGLSPALPGTLPPAATPPPALRASALSGAAPEWRAPAGQRP